MRAMIPRPKSKFLKVTCSKCKNEQIVFNKSSTKVKCLVCGGILAENTGGKSKVRARVIQVMD